MAAGIRDTWLPPRAPGVPLEGGASHAAPSADETDAPGHRSLPHTADVILEAWGPDVAVCCEEAVAALVETYADATHAAISDRRRWHVAPGQPEEMLLDLLDEVIFVLDTSHTGVPVAAAVDPAPDGGFDVVFDLAVPASLESTGGVPKAISRSGLRFETGPWGARCSFLVDL